MGEESTLRAYLRRYLGRFWKDAWEWPRDNIFFAFAMVVVPPVAAWLCDPTHVPDWAVIKTAGWIYLAVLVAYAICHLARTAWKLDSDRAEELQGAFEAAAASKTALTELNLKYSNELPLLGLNVHSVQGEKTWRTTGVPVAFTIQHLGGRIPTSIRFDPVRSKLGKFLLRFDPLPHADRPPQQTGIGFEVLETGAPQLSAKDWATTQQYQGELLRLFVHDVPSSNATEDVYDLVARFRDRSDDCEQAFRLVFDRYRFCFSPNTV